MVGSDPGSAREETERLIATVMAAVRLATAGAGTDGGRTAPGGGYGGLGEIFSTLLGHRGGLATGSAECQLCPICRAISALRDPRPEVAERIAAGAGDLAVGVASLMRAFATVTGASAETGGEPGRAEPAGTGSGYTPTGPGGPTGPGERATDRGPDQAGDPWRVTTRTGHDLWSAPEPDVWAAATRSEPVSRSGGSGDPPVTRTGPVPASRTPAEELAAGSDDTPGDGA